MKLIALPTQNDQIDDHFGHCEYYTVVTIDDENAVVKKDRLESPKQCGCKSDIAFKMQEMGITLMLAGNMGMGAYNKLNEHGINVIRGCKGDIDDVIADYLANRISDSMEVCSHHECHDKPNQPDYSNLKMIK